MRRTQRSLRAVAALVLLVLVGSCDDLTSPSLEKGAGVATPSHDRQPVVVVADLGPQFQKVTLTREGEAVPGHHVTVNAAAIPHAGAGLYQGQLPAAVGAGSSIELLLGGDGLIIYAMGAGTVPEAPVLTAPVTGAVFDAGDSVMVTWTSATNPDRFVVTWISDGATFKADTAAGTARWVRVSAGALPAGADLSVSVVACNDGSFTGLVHPDSHMGTMSVGDARVIAIQR